MALVPLFGQVDSEESQLFAELGTAPVAYYPNFFAEKSGLSLALYAQIMGYDENALFGVAYPRAEDYGRTCRYIWLKRERDTLAWYLWESQREIEKITNYPISPRWITKERHNCFRNPVMAKQHKIIAGGIRGETLIQSAATVDWTNIHLADITVSYSGVATNEEIEIRHTGTPYTIVMSSVAVGSGQIVIRVPRARMVKPEWADNPPEGWEYEDEEIFADMVDVYRVYNDTTTQANLVCRDYCVPNCDETLSPACIWVKNSNQGVVEVVPTTQNACTCRATQVELNYLAGEEITPESALMLIRLTHSKMPEAPCGCDVMENVWKADNASSAFLTRERLNCPFGISNSAWIAYSWALAQQSVRITPMHGYFL